MNYISAEELKKMEIKTTLGNYKKFHNNIQKGNQMGKNMSIAIYLRNGDIRGWKSDEYTEYDFKGNFFVVMKYDRWIGMYAIDRIDFIEVRPDRSKEQP